MSETLIDPVPLGIIHTDAYDDYRESLMQRVEGEWRAGRLTLWGYHRGERWRGPKPIPYPYALELDLDWVAEPGREDAGNPRFPGLEYYCDVGAHHHDNARDFWSELLIARADLDRLRTQPPKVALLANRRLPPSRLKPFWPQAEAAALLWLEENGCPRPGDGNQAILETVVADWLAEHGYEASSSTIRRHVRDCMTRYRRDL
jgi:hypothetical protein